MGSQVQYVRTEVSVFHPIDRTHMPATGLNPLKVINEVRHLCSELHVVVGEDSLSLEAKRNATLLFHAFLRATLASKRVLSEYRLTEDAFEYLIGEIKTRFYEVCTFVGFNVLSLSSMDARKLAHRISKLPGSVR